jgi:hypothetical protein
MSVRTGPRQAVVPDAPSAAIAATEFSTQANRAPSRRTAQLSRTASDDEILGIGTAAEGNPDEDGSAGHPRSDDASAEDGEASTSVESQGGAELEPRAQAALDSIPELRRAWQDAQSYRESFATPEEARAATALLNDLDRMDTLFFSRRPEDHLELARAVANLDPVAFASLAKAMSDMKASTAQQTNSRSIILSPSDRRDEKSVLEPDAAKRDPSADQRRPAQDDRANRQTADAAETQNPTPAQIEFLHAANAAAVQGVLDAIETQVERLLPQGVSKTARNRVVGEIYRELDATLGSNRQLGQQMREAFRSGNLDAAHQRAIVALVTGRARQTLPVVAKRVLNEWTSTVVAANQDRLTRQRTAAHRVDIAGSGRGGDGGRRSLAPRDIDYARMSDSDILNL